MNASWEAWQDQAKPIQIGLPLFQYTATKLLFTVIDADREAVNLTGFVGKFAAQPVDNETTQLDKNITLVDAANGQCKVDFTSADLAFSKECLGELRLWSTGNTADDVTHRVHFRFFVAKAIVQGAGA